MMYPILPLTILNVLCNNSIIKKQEVSMQEAVNKRLGTVYASEFLF